MYIHVRMYYEHNKVVYICIVEFSYAQSIVWPAILRAINCVHKIAEIATYTNGVHIVNL